MYKVFIDGREGTTGLRIYERLSAMGGVEVLALTEERRKLPEARGEMIEKADVTFLCLPDEAARESVALAGSGARILDASTAHRTAPGWVYGFPERNAAAKEAIRFANRVAVPGCHASGYIALVYPLVAAGVLNKEALLGCQSLTGYSGGGKKMIAEYEAPGRDVEYESPRAYALGQQHKHVPEMLAYAGLDCPPVFLPVVSCYYAGMLVSVPLHMQMLNGCGTIAALREVYAQHYANQAFVNVIKGGEESPLLAANTLCGKDGMEICVAGNDERAVLYARYDNLGKGASGAALQCMNLMLGLEETKGLSL